MKIESSHKKDKMDLSEYLGALKDSPLLDKLEADSRKIKELAKPRTCFLDFETKAPPLPERYAFTPILNRL